MKQFEKEFTEAFAKRIGHYGFTKRKATGIYKKTSFGKFGVRLGFRKTLYGYDVTMFLSVRIDEVERLSNLFPPNRFWKETSTLDTELGRYTTGETKVWSLTHPEDEGIGDIYLKVLESIGAPKSGLESDVA